MDILTNETWHVMIEITPVFYLSSLSNTLGLTSKNTTLLTMNFKLYHVLEMSLMTIVIGSYPKPEYLRIPDWFHTESFTSQLGNYEKYLNSTDIQGDLKCFL